MGDIIKEELNVKEVIIRDNEEELVEYSCKANFKVLGKILGKDMKAAASVIEGLGGSEISGLLNGKTLEISIDGIEHRDVEITAEHVIVSRQEKIGLKVLNEGMLTIALIAN
jgi:isoleucyl-tRNA synthetase